MLGVTLSDDNSCDSEVWSVAISKKLSKTGTGEGVCTNCTNDVNIFSIAQISAESWIDLVFVESSGMGLFELV